MKQSEVSFPCGSLSLEGAFHLPEGSGPFPAVAVCHPHPLFGGSMEVNVVLAICDALAQESVGALRFNFRGVGGSGGAFGGANDEQEDVRAALSFLSSMEGVERGRIGLVGYSFGALVALPVALQDGRVQALALISLLLAASPDSEGLMSYLKPKILLCGGRDDFIPVPEFLHLVERIPEPKQYEVISGADHFWWGYEEKVAGAVATFFAEAL